VLLVALRVGLRLVDDEGSNHRSPFFLECR
jgi:hypothetical protein